MPYRHSNSTHIHLCYNIMSHSPSHSASCSALVNSYSNSAFPYSMMTLGPSAFGSFQEVPSRVVPFPVDPCRVVPFPVVVLNLLEAPFQDRAPYHAESPSDPFPMAHSVIQSWDQMEAYQMVDQNEALVSFLVVDLSCPVVDHALESLDLQVLARLDPIQDLDLGRETVEEVLC